MTQVFRLYASCILVCGVKRAVICDLQRQGLFFVSLSLYKILESSKNLSLDEILDTYKDENDIAGFYQSLIENDLGFWTDEPELFPEIDLHWEGPTIITNAIIDQNTGYKHDFNHIFNQLEEVGCGDVQIRCYNSLDISSLVEIVELLEGRRIKSVEFIVKYDNAVDLEQLYYLTDIYPRIKSITVHSAPSTNVYHYKGMHGVNMGNIIMTEQKIDSNQCCGIIDPSFFNVGIATFTEGQQHNSCLNRKVGIDTDGSIKNCPSLKNIHGNIYEDKLIDIVVEDQYQELWKINKDKIDICKVCEFRHVCTDCRAFHETDNSYHKPFKCNYDPYTLEWKN